MLQRATVRWSIFAHGIAIPTGHRIEPERKDASFLANRIFSFDLTEHFMRLFKMTLSVFFAVRRCIAMLAMPSSGDTDKLRWSSMLNIVAIILLSLAMAWALLMATFNAIAPIQASCSLYTLLTPTNIIEHAISEKADGKA